MEVLPELPELLVLQVMPVLQELPVLPELQELPVLPEELLQEVDYPSALLRSYAYITQTSVYIHIR